MVEYQDGACRQGGEERFKEPPAEDVEAGEPVRRQARQLNARPPCYRMGCGGQEMKQLGRVRITSVDSVPDMMQSTGAEPRRDQRRLAGPRRSGDPHEPAPPRRVEPREQPAPPNESRRRRTRQLCER
jgi:hypothetical protein